MTALGDLIEIDDRTVLVLGQELDLGRGQPDVANALVHRAGDTLVLVDTGVTQPFRTALLEAAGRVGPWSRALVLTTHGHHVGNNDLADGLGVPAEHGAEAVSHLDRLLSRAAALQEAGLGLRPESDAPDAPWSRPPSRSCKPDG